MKRNFSDLERDASDHYTETSEPSSSSSSQVLYKISAGTVLNSQYEVSTFLSRGGHGEIFLATDSDHHQYAIKMQPFTMGHRMLHHEMIVSQRLQSDPLTGLFSFGVPRVFNYFTQFGHEFLVMERMGESLRDKVEASPGKRLSKKSALMIGIQVVRILEVLHDHHVLHRDVKPANLVVGLGADERTVSIIDFGVSEIVQDWTDYDPEATCQFAGTPAYAPAEAYFQKQPTRGGDLQSLAYSLVEIVSGSLPWTYMDEEYNRRLTPGELGIQRLLMKPERLCENFPELTPFVKSVCRTKKNDQPKYEKLVEQLETALSEIGCSNDGCFDWMVTEHVESTETPVQPDTDQQKEVFHVVKPLAEPLAEMGEEAIGKTKMALRRDSSITHVSGTRTTPSGEKESPQHKEVVQASRLCLPNLPLASETEETDGNDQVAEMEEEILETLPESHEDLDQFSNVEDLPQPPIVHFEGYMGEDHISETKSEEQPLPLQCEIQADREETSEALCRLPSRNDVEEESPNISNTSTPASKRFRKWRRGIPSCVQQAVQLLATATSNMVMKCFGTSA